MARRVVGRPPKEPQRTLEQLISTTLEGGNSKAIFELFSGRGPEALRLLIDRGANVNTRNPSDGRTPVMQNVLLGHRDAALFLIANGADVKSRDICDGSNSVSLAARNGDAELLKLLIDAGAEIGPQNRDLRTPLHEAYRSGSSACVSILLRAGLDPEDVDVFGRTPEMNKSDAPIDTERFRQYANRKGIPLPKFKPPWGEGLPESDPAIGIGAIVKELLWDSPFTGRLHLASDLERSFHFTERNLEKILSRFGVHERITRYSQRNYRTNFFSEGSPNDWYDRRENCWEIQFELEREVTSAGSYFLSPIVVNDPDFFEHDPQKVRQADTNPSEVDIIADFLYSTNQLH